MLSNLFFTIFLVGAIGAILIAVLIVSVIASIVLWIAYLMGEDDLREDTRKKVFFWAKVSTIVFAISVPLVAFTPSKTDIITYLALKELDNYNKEHASSSLTPNGFYGSLDNTVKDLGTILDSISKKTKELTK